jgi:hypothetical protein
MYPQRPNVLLETAFRQAVTNQQAEQIPYTPVYSKSQNNKYVIPVSLLGSSRETSSSAPMLFSELLLHAKLREIKKCPTSLNM